MGDATRSHVRKPDLLRIAVGTIFGFLAFLAILPLLLGEGNVATKAKGCAQAERRLAVALLLYGGDYDEKLPANDWAKVSFDPPKGPSWPQTYEDLKCPALAPNRGSGYALLQGLAKVDEKDFASMQVMLFETDTSGWNVVAPLSALSSHSRHNHLFSFAYTDSHVRSLGEEAVAKGLFKN